jgi:hypothetical protein
VLYDGPLLWTRNDGDVQVHMVSFIQLHLFLFMKWLPCCEHLDRLYHIHEAELRRAPFSLTAKPNMVWRYRALFEPTYPNTRMRSVTGACSAERQTFGGGRCAVGSYAPLNGACGPLKIRSKPTVPFS